MLFVPHWVHSLLHWLSVHWGDGVPAWLAVIVAAAFGWLSWCSSRRSAAAERESRAAEREVRQHADRATTAAQDAAAAADRSAAAAERSATAHEAQAALLQDAADAAGCAPWRIERRDSADWAVGQPHQHL